MAQNIKIIGIFVLAIVIASLTTHYLFPQIILIEPETETITIAIGHGYHYSIPVIMEYFNLLEKYSNGTVALKIEVLKSGIITEGLIAGSIHFAQRSGPAILKNLDDGAPVKILASMGKKEHELWTSDPNINSLADLTQDTIVNLVTPTSIQSIGLKVGLQRIGKTLDDITPLYITHADAYQLMISNEITCHFVGAPYASRYASEPDKYHLLETDSTIFQMALPGSLLYATTGYVEENPKIVAYVLASWYEAISWINENQEETSLIVAGSYNDPLDTAYRDWQDANMEFNPTFGLAGLATLSELLYDNDIISRPYEPDEILFPIGLGGRC